MHTWPLLLTLLFCVKCASAQHIYDMENITEVKIYLEQENWDSILQATKAEEERLIGDAFVNGEKYEQVGVRYKGNSSYHNPIKAGVVKLPFNIKIDKELDDQLLPGEYGTLKLSNVFRDPTFVRELLSYEIARKYMPASRANYAKVYVNDKYFGVYHNVESIDHRFLREYFKNDDGYLFKCDPIWSIEQSAGCKPSDKASLEYLGEDSTCYFRYYELKDDFGWTELVQLTKTLSQQPERLEEILDVDRALWMLAYNSVLVNLDSYTGMLGHNYYLYRDTAGVFHPIVWDMNLSFGGFRRLNQGEAPLSNAEMQTLSPFIHYKDQNEKRPLITQLLGNDLYRKTYMAHIRTILDENFVNGWYLERAKELQEFIESEVMADEQKLYANDFFRKNLDTTTVVNDESIIGIAELMEKRTEYLLSHPLFAKEAPVISEVTHEVSDEQVLVTTKMAHEETAWLYYRYGAGDNFRRIPMHDDGEQGDEQAGDHRWAAQFPHGPDAQYYIVAEGSRVAKLSPRRASNEFYTVDDANNATTSKAK
jgi:hypothetical protein